MEYKEYVVEKSPMPDFDTLLVCLSHESILNYLEKIEEEKIIKNHSGKLLIDQMTVTGNGDNRFLMLEYKDGKLDLNTAEVCLPIHSYREHSAEKLKDQIQFLENSILSDDEFRRLKNGETL